MQTLLLVGAIYLLFLAPAVIGGFVVWLVGRKQIRLLVADWSLLLVPFVLWLGLGTIGLIPKTLSNIVEAFALGGAVVLLFAARTFLDRVPHQQPRLALASVAGACIFAIALWAFVPALPE
jgi:hypothetical protein